MSTNVSDISAGVVTGDEVQAIFEDAQDRKYALPAANVVGTNSINAAMETARDLNAPVIIQLSSSGALFYAGKSLENGNLEGSVLGSISAAEHVHKLAPHYGARVIMHTDHCPKKRLAWVDGLLDAGEVFYKTHGVPLFSSHMLDLSVEPIEENVEICKRYLERMSEMGMTLELELGISGGE